MPDFIVAQHNVNLSETLAVSDSVYTSLRSRSSAEITSRINLESFTIWQGRPVKFSGLSGCLLAQADDIANIAVGLAMDTTPSGGIVTVLLLGPLNLTDWSVSLGGPATLTANERYYLSMGAAGVLTTIPPTGTGQVWQPVGYALSDTELFLQLQTAIIV